MAPSTTEQDLEKLQPERLSATDVEVVDSEAYNGKGGSVWKWLAERGVEVRGISPVPIEERTKTNFISILFMWISILTNLLP